MYVWASQFADISVTTVIVAVNKLIATNTFPPTIREVKNKIRGLYWEALGQLPHQCGGLYPYNTDEIPHQKLAMLQQIVADASKLRATESNETSLEVLLSGCEKYINDKGPKQLKEGN